MLSSLRLVCLCISTSRLYSFQPTVSSPLVAALIVRSERFTTRAMTTSPADGSSVGVGQADIGNGNQDVASIDSIEGKSWRSLLEASNAKSRKIRGSNYVQLATVDPKSNEPRCRSVVFRGFLKLPVGHSCLATCDDLSCVLKMCTDRRSEKVDQIRALPTAELLWYFPKYSEQYRIRGQLLLVGLGDFGQDDDKDLAVARKELWGNLSDSSRESFLTNEKPGAVYTCAGESHLPSRGRDQDGKLLPPPDDFLMMLLIPKHCDYLRLTSMYRQVDEFVEGKWQAHRVNP